MIAEQGFFGGDIETIYKKPVSIVLDTYNYIRFKSDFRHAIEKERESRNEHH